MAAKIEERLQRALDEQAPEEPIQAVVTLKHGADGRALSPEATERSVKQMVDQACVKVSAEARKVKVFKNLQSFSIDAPAKLVRAVLEEGSAKNTIDSASLNAAPSPSGSGRAP